MPTLVTTPQQGRIRRLLELQRPETAQPSIVDIEPATMAILQGLTNAKSEHQAKETATQIAQTPAPVVSTRIDPSTGFVVADVKGMALHPNGGGPDEAIADAYAQPQRDLAAVVEGAAQSFGLPTTRRTDIEKRLNDFAGLYRAERYSGRGFIGALIGAGLVKALPDRAESAVRSKITDAEQLRRIARVGATVEAAKPVFEESRANTRLDLENQREQDRLKAEGERAKREQDRLDRLMSNDEQSVLAGIDFTLSDNPLADARARLGHDLTPQQVAAVDILKRQQVRSTSQRRFDELRKDKAALGTYASFDEVKKALGSGAFTGEQLSQLNADYRAARQQVRAAEARADRAAQGIVTKQDQAADIADAIVSGDQPPDMKGMYGLTGPVRAALKQRGFDLTRATLDWKATDKQIATLNGPQQTRLRQAVNATYDQLDVVDGLYDEWVRAGASTGLKAFNRASLATAKNLPGKAGEVATALEQQISLLTGELGNTLMGGNSPTDHALELAGKMLAGEWNEQTFKRAIKQLRIDLQIRKNSIANTGPAGSTGRYTPNAPQTGRVVTDTNEILNIFGKGKTQ